MDCLPLDRHARMVNQRDNPLAYFADRPLEFAEAFWPRNRFYAKQREVIESVRDNDETYCYAGHQLGKDYLAGFVVLWYFLSHYPCRIVTTSVKDDHLRVLWGEVGRFIDTCSVPLRVKDGGLLVTKHRELLRVVPQPNRAQKEWPVCKISYVKGMVSEKGEGMAGHHAPFTLLVMDECSGVDELVPERASSWAKKILGIGNPYGGVHTWFYKICDAGDVPHGAVSKSLIP